MNNQDVNPKYFLPIVLSLLIIYGSFTAILFGIHKVSPIVKIKNEEIRIRLGHSRTIPFEKVDSIYLYPNIPFYHTNKHAGNETWRKGRFRTQDGKFIHVHLGTLDAPIIKIDVENDEPSYISMRNMEKTRALYNELKEELHQYGVIDQNQ